MHRGGFSAAARNEHNLPRARARPAPQLQKSQAVYSEKTQSFICSRYTLSEIGRQLTTISYSQDTKMVRG